jgi:alpha-ribazole phosphatase
VITWGLPPGATMRLVLVRHGEPDERIHGRCYGRLDVGLSQCGREQMQRVKCRLRDAPVAALYTSPRRRALESARVLAAQRWPVRVDDRLREIDFGKFEGLPYDEIAARFPQQYEDWMHGPTEVSFPGGESFAAMETRVRQALAQLREEHPGQLVVVVSHGGVNRIALAAALELESHRIFRLDQGYACLNVIDYFGCELLVRLVNLEP